MSGGRPLGLRGLRGLKPPESPVDTVSAGGRAERSFITAICSFNVPTSGLPFCEGGSLIADDEDDVPCKMEALGKGGWKGVGRRCAAGEILPPPVLQVESMPGNTRSRKALVFFFLRNEAIWDICLKMPPNNLCLRRMKKN